MLHSNNKKHTVLNTHNIYHMMVVTSEKCTHCFCS